MALETAITIIAIICIAAPTVLAGSTAQAEKAKPKYNIKYKVNITHITSISDLDYSFCYPALFPLQQLMHHF